ncbi:Hemolysin-type calcium-binding repeat-containing protein [Polaromonas sp. OV174]|uniref:beta strand repeat-containing protein n=1 Tax=Polaromonas sp. OV174 TaxID=1855300 RepID=UPI0008EA8EFD|nr:hypothetical protein [Polaromonas sp. OV174]SFC17380.1 Hemolysin-type calcium-binding repeat-containing protein [Polaromonas sp. OV174]
MAITAQERTNITKLVVAMFNAAPGATYLAELTVAYEANGRSLSNLAKDLATNASYKALNPVFQTAAEFAAAFLTPLGLQNNTEAKDFITAKFNAGVSKGQIALDAATAIDGYTGGDAAIVAAKAILVNKTAVAEYYSEIKLVAQTNIGSLQQVIATVTADAASVAAANTAIDNGAGAAAGNTFTLTSSVDSIVGTSGNDTIIAGTQAGLATLTAGDQINGGSGTDTLSIFGNGNASAFTSATVSSVEVVTAQFDATGGALNVSGNAGVTQVNIGNSVLTNAAGSGSATVTLTKAQAAGINGTILNDTTTSLAGNNAVVTFAFSDVTGGADTATLNVNNAKFAKNALNVLGAGSGVTIAGVETLNIAATGTNALGNLLAADTTKLVITGAGSLSATLTGTLAKTIDGSAATGNLTIDNKAAAIAIQSIKTGSGNDVYTTKWADLTADDSIDLGTGTDSLRFSDDATFTTAAQKAQLTKVVGVEQLGTVGAVLTVDGDFVSQTSYYTDGAAGQMVLTNTANNADVNFGKGAELASSVAMKLGANTLNVNLAGSATGAADLGLGLTVTGSATVNVKSTGTDGQPNNVLALTAADNQSVVVTGSQNLTLTTFAASNITGFKIDGSAFTGKLAVTGTAASDIIVGGSGNDIISGGAGAAISDTLTGGAGNDKFIIIAGATATAADVITDFVTAADTIAFAATVGTALTFTKGTAAVADFAAALLAANTALAVSAVAGSTEYVAQQVGSDTYVFYAAAAGSVATQAVKLVGVDLAHIAAADIVAI